MKNTARKVRTIVAAVFFICINLFFLGSFHWLGWTVKVQFMPALLSVAVCTFVFLLLITLLMGRIYCSTLCPLGVMQDCFNWLSRKANKRKKYSFSKSKNVLRYGILIAFVGILIAGGTLFAAILEPYSIYSRFITHLFKPALMAVNNLMTPLSDKLGWYVFLHSDIFIQSIFALGLSIVLFLLIAFLSYKWGRTWCNTICPVGTFLGLLGKVSCWKVTIDADKCTHCLVCGRKCKASCIDSKNQKIDYSRCVDCFDCLDACNQHALVFTPTWKGKQKTIQVVEENRSQKSEYSASVDTSRRQFLVSAALLTVGLPKVMAEQKINKTLAKPLHKQPYQRKTPILPPGAQSLKHFQQHCTSCHLCVSQCPNKVLRPATREYGLAGFMQPTMQFDRGNCDTECNRCSTICPVGAIVPLTLAEKKKTQVGYAVFTQKNCVAVTDNVNCGNCARHCPVEAIKMVDLDDDHMIPLVNVNKCIGCGACEYHCPAKPYSAIHVEGYEVQKKKAK